ncbi:MAG: D-alanine--D-alanine ligase [Clostridia bacterium]|nr:D-alanine--D-alanine ligase [Clostridia bacterium]
MDILVLCGGLSPEREVSLCSATMVTNALLDKGHRAVMVDLFFGLPGFDGDFEALFSNARQLPAHVIDPDAPDLNAVKRSRKDEGDTDEIGKNVLALCRYADMVYMGLHGDSGENGRLQALLDECGVRYTGSGAEASRLAIDKWESKRVFRENGILVPNGILLRRGEAVELNQLPFPCVVKPCCGGSSIGTTLVRDKELLPDAIELAFLQEDRIIVEELIEGRELSVGVLGGDALPPIEIMPNSGFYDYRNKYIAGLTREICPAPIKSELRSRICAAAVRGFEALKMAVYGRLDFMLTEDGRFYCMEANTLPGMTPTSLLPQEAQAAGVDYASLCQRIVELSKEKR